MENILQEIIDSKRLIKPITYVPAGTRIIIYPMVDLHIRTREDIINNVKTVLPGTGEGGLVNETSTETVSVGGGSSQTNGKQQVVLGNEEQQKPSGGTPLISDETTNNEKKTPKRHNVVMPPPAADGSNAMEYDEEAAEEGEIDLSF